MSAESVDAECQNLQQENTNGEKPCDVVSSKATKERVYNTSHPGKAIIFNHTEYYSPNLRPRESSKEDVQALINTLAIFGVAVDVRDNFFVKDIKDEIKTGITGNDLFVGKKIH